MSCIEARGLAKAYGSTVALGGIDLAIEEGRIVGLIGPNGAGKTTALNAVLGLTPYEGQLKVLGRDPWIERDRLMRDVSFIADVAVLPFFAPALTAPLFIYLLAPFGLARFVLAGWLLMRGVNLFNWDKRAAEPVS